MITLYKKDTKNKIRVLKLYAEGSEVVQVSGVVDGKLVENRSPSKAKNVGKSNETTAEEQALKEVLSKETDKLTKGYFYTIEEAETTKLILPMLAKVYKKEMKKIRWNSGEVYAQTKLDGMRCLAEIKDGVVSLISRQGKDVNNMEHIEANLASVDVGNIVLDGELYCHGRSFQENMKLIDKYREGESELILFRVYDVMVDKPYNERFEIIKDIVPNFSVCRLIEQVNISSEEELVTYHKTNVAEGYEGTIVRHGDDGYKVNGRSSSLLKYKDFFDLAVKVVDIIPMEKRPEQGKVVCELEGGGTFKANLKMSFKEREEVLINKENYIGMTAEIRYTEYNDPSEAKDKDGNLLGFIVQLPRIATCHGFRLDK